nr:unnamed protein product [Digitaria exilis]
MMPHPKGVSAEEDAVVVVAAGAIATSEPDAGDPELQRKKGGRRRRRKKRRPRAPTEEEVAARRFVLRWAFHGREAASDDDERGAGPGRAPVRRPRVSVELHAHSTRSDGTLSPADLVERAHRNGVKVLALTDHDTMAGVQEAVEAAKRYPIRIIPGVEISAVHSARQAFSRYLYDGGPAYAKGSEPTGESVVQLVCQTGGLAVLAHPWALKNPSAVIKNLKAAGLHGIEAYRSDGKVSGMNKG